MIAGVVVARARRGVVLRPDRWFGALPAQTGIAECGQFVEQGDGLAEVFARAVVVLGVVGIGAVEQRGQGDLDRVEACVRSQWRRLRQAAQRVLSGQIRRPQVPASSSRSTPGHSCM